MKKVIYTALAVMMVVALVGVIILISNAESKNILRDISPTEAAKEAYASGGEILTHDFMQDLSFDGFMRCYSLIYIPEAKELQITVKSNKSVYAKLSTTESEGYLFLLYNTETEDENRNYTLTRDFDNQYGYYRLVFEGVEFSDAADLEVVMLSPNDSEKGSVVKIHKHGQEFEEYKLSEKEIASLGA